MTDLAAIKHLQQQAWGTGDYTMIGASTVLVSELLCEAVALRAGHKVLDVATGSGNTALAAARRGAEAHGVDYVPELLARAQKRAAAESLQVTFYAGDTEHLPFPDAAFDVVLSTFGVMFAPNQTQAARELLRVCRAGGTIGLANWTPEGFSGQNFRITGSYLPSVPGLLTPTRWGTADDLGSLFGNDITTLRAEKRTVVLRARSAQQYLALTRTYLGPVMQVFARLSTEAQEALQRDLLANIQRFNQVGATTMHVAAEYLEAVATRR
ncbi:MAG: class I SAM-dependent methyltransferase [Candidatus Tectimicrobiota bacterium]